MEMEPAGFLNVNVWIWVFVGKHKSVRTLDAALSKWMSISSSKPEGYSPLKLLSGMGSEFCNEPEDAAAPGVSLLIREPAQSFENHHPEETL